MIAPEGFKLPHVVGYIFGGLSVIAGIVGFWLFLKKQKA